MKHLPLRRSRRAKRAHLALAAIVLLIGALDGAHGTDASSRNFRLIGAAPANVSASTTSPAYRVYLVGGSGQPVGISASPNISVVAGGTSNTLPTTRIFANGMEP